MRKENTKRITGKNTLYTRHKTQDTRHKTQAGRQTVLATYVLGLIHDNILKVLANNHSHGAVVVLGHRLRLEVGLELAVEESLNVVLDKAK